jgi:putative ABC transport system ATP-binding protein
MSALIEIHDLVRIYRMGQVEVRALDGVDLTVEQGEFVAVMGPSGSGKSTLMNIVGCLDRPTAGTYRLTGTDVSRIPANARAEIRNTRIGFVFQSFNLLPRTSGLENVELPLLYGGGTLTPRDRAERARRCLALVGLAGYERNHPSQLSGGEQQRVAIARALVTDPPLILADEPTGNLDSHTSEEILSLFQELNDAGRTVVLITHEPDVARHAKRQIVVRDGRIVQDQALTQVRLDVAGGRAEAAS